MFLHGTPVEELSLVVLSVVNPFEGITFPSIVGCWIYLFIYLSIKEYQIKADSEE